MLAVMGPSGAGKSTFLSCISRRVRSSGLTGELLLDGTVLSPTSNALKHLSTFVMQEEALYGSLTVYENILYAAELSLPGLTRAERAAKIDLVIKEMGLERVRNTIIGTVVQRGVSGGEKRRTSVAAQLVTDPKILFLDEPTSGLDSAAAFKVMETIRNLARETKVTVIATIHQPSTETFQLFDDLLLLAPGGRPVYFGAREKAIDYFASLGKPCPPYFNPADHFLDLINTDFIEDREVAAKQIESLVAAWKESRLTETNDKLDKEMGGKQSPVVTKTMSFNKTMSFGKSMSFGTSAADAHKYKAGILLQTWILTRRTFVNYSRNIVGYGIRLFMYGEYLDLLAGDYSQAI